MIQCTALVVREAIAVVLSFFIVLFGSSDGQVYPHLPHDRCVHYSIFLILFGIIINRDYCFHYNVVIIIYQIYITYQR